MYRNESETSLVLQETGHDGALEHIEAVHFRTIADGKVSFPAIVRYMGWDDCYYTVYRGNYRCATWTGCP